MHLSLPTDNSTDKNQNAQKHADKPGTKRTSTHSSLTNPHSKSKDIADDTDSSLRNAKKGSESPPARIEQRGKSSWRVTVTDGYNNGKQNRIRETYKFPQTWPIERQREEIEKLASALEAKLKQQLEADFKQQFVPVPEKNHIDDTSEDMLFSEYAKLWLKEYAEVNMQPKTLYQCEVKLNHRILPFFAQYRLSQIKQLVITRFINDLSGTIIDETSMKKLSPQTVNHYISLLSSMFSMAIRWELMTSNPCSKVTKPKINHGDVLILDENDSRLLIQLIEDAPIKYRCIVLAALMTGLRLGELVALKWHDIDFASKILKVERAKSYVPGKGCFDKEPKTRTSRRSITVPQKLLDTFQMLKAEQNRQKENLMDKWHDSDYLFTAHDGLPMGHNTPTRWFKDFLDSVRERQRQEQLSAGVPESELKLFPKMRFHDTRHVHASILIVKSVDIQTVSRRLGHARASTTANIYGHPLMANDAKASAIIESELT